jgi:uncharacterized protein
MTAGVSGTPSDLPDRDRSRSSFPGKYLRVTTFRRDGTPVATPVWFVEDEGRLFVETDAASFKVKRIRRNPEVSVAPCTASGKPKGNEVGARAEILGPEPPARVRELMARKYRVDRIVILPIYRAVQAIRHKGSSHGNAVVLAITPAA